jgi:two-component system nitrate/nitrite response regulator NarL
VRQVLRMGTDSGFGRLSEAWQASRTVSVVELAKRGIDSLARRAGWPVPADRGSVMWLHADMDDLAQATLPPQLVSQRYGGLNYRIAGLVPALADDLEGLLKRHHPRLLVADVAWCDIVGPRALRHLHRHLPHIDWILCWDEVSPRWLDALVCTGARGAVMRDADEIEVAHTFDAVLAGEVWLPRRVLQWLYATIVEAPGAESVSTTQSFSSTLPSLDSRLTSREAEVVGLLRQGLTNREIALRLDVSINTVKKHVAAAYEKQGIRSRRQTLG